MCLKWLINVGNIKRKQCAKNKKEKNKEIEGGKEREKE